MKFMVPMWIFIVLLTQQSYAQVVVEDGFKFGSPHAGEEFDGPAQRANESVDWPVDDSELRVTEVKFAKKTMTKWHRNKNGKYLVTTDGTGQVQWYNSGGQLQTKKFGKESRIYIPAMVCHRYGAENRVLSQVVITTSANQWDECHEEFVPQEASK